MLGFDRRIVLEDHLGDRHPVYLLESIQGHFFVLLPPDAADELLAGQASGGGLEPALEILEARLMIMDVRTHHFLPPEDLPGILAQAAHPVLRMVGERAAEDLRELDEGADDLSAQAFAEECKRRAGR